MDNTDERAQADIRNVGIILAVYKGETTADDVGSALAVQIDTNKEYFIGDSVIVRKNEEGKVKITESEDLNPGEGAGIGAALGSFIGLLGGPAGMLTGLLGGAALGGLSAYKDVGFDQASLEELGGALIPDSSAILVLIAKEYYDVYKADDEVDAESQLTTAKELSRQISENLEAGRDTVFCLVLGEDELAAGQITVADGFAEVLGLAGGNTGLVMGQVVNNDKGLTYDVMAIEGSTDN